MPSARPTQRIVIAGASSLLGAELKSLLEESRFAGWELSLVDEDTAAGTLTEAGGEPSVIQPVEEGTFSQAKLIFFAGSAGFTQSNLAAARASGGTVIDLSGASFGAEGAGPWFGVEALDLKVDQNKTLYAIPSAPGLTAARLLDALGRIGLQRLAITFFRPVSEAGRVGIEELEAQTSQLLSFQSVGQPLFDTQVAFNLLDHYGPGSREQLQLIRERIRQEASTAAGSDFVHPSIQVLHAPVFYGYTFSAVAEVNSKQTKEGLAEACRKAGFVLEVEACEPLGNLTGSGDAVIHLALPEADSAQPGTWWFWGAADNIRLPAATAVKLAEKLIE